MNKRKHYTQMSDGETAHVLRRVRTQQYRYSVHAINRARAKGVPSTAIERAIYYGGIVEAHNNVEGSICVLLRGNDVRGRACCVVVDIVTKTVVTTYWNDNGDNHSTLDKSLYAWNQDLTKI